MAGNFYTLEEVTAKLGKTEAQVKGLVKDGQLREFRDGSKLLFKIDEVDALAEKQDGIDITAADEIAKADMAASGSDISLSLEETGDISLEPIDEAPTEEDDGLDALGLTGLGELTGADTNVGTTGINVLGETDEGYKLAGDTKGDTIADDEDADDFLGDLDDDINMESVGSGSGLLDLSLQADDTSLGAVLDDILPAAAEGDAGDIMPTDMGIGDEPDIFEQPDEPAPSALPEPVATAPMAEPQRRAPAGVYYEPEPTGVDNALAITLFIPLAAMAILAIVIFAAFKGIVPSLLSSLQGEAVAGLPMIWCIALGLGILILLIVLIAALLGGKKPKTQKA